MSSSPEDASSTRWNMLSKEVRSLESTLSRLVLAGVLDRDANYIADIQEEVDRRTREALVANWLSKKHGELPQGIA